MPSPASCGAASRPCAKRCVRSRSGPESGRAPAMPDQPADFAMDEERLNGIIAAYDAELRRKARGWERNELRRRYLADHPKLAAALEQYFDDEHNAELHLRGVDGIPRWLPDFDNLERIEYL